MPGGAASHRAPPAGRGRPPHPQPGGRAGPPAPRRAVSGGHRPARRRLRGNPVGECRGAVVRAARGAAPGRRAGDAPAPAQGAGGSSGSERRSRLATSKAKVRIESEPCWKPRWTSRYASPGSGGAEDDEGRREMLGGGRRHAPSAQRRRRRRPRRHPGRGDGRGAPPRPPPPRAAPVRRRSSPDHRAKVVHQPAAADDPHPVVAKAAQRRPQRSEALHAPGRPGVRAAPPGRSASGSRNRSGIHAPWSSPRSGSTRAGRPCVSERGGHRLGQRGIARDRVAERVELRVEPTEVVDGRRPGVSGEDSGPPSPSKCADTTRTARGRGCPRAQPARAAP